MSRATDDIQMLASADLLLLIGRLLAPPARVDPDTLDDLSVAALGRQLDDAGARGLDDTLAATMEAARRTPRDDWSLEYTRLFDGSVACPITETAYVRRDKGAIIADLCGFYGTFGFEPVASSGEKPDHMVCELEFTAMLLVMLARARGDEESETVTRDALRMFLQDHLGQWISLFAARLAATTRLPLMEGVAALLAEAWDLLAEPLHLPPLASLEVVPPDPDDADGTPYECGMVESDQPVTLTGPPGSGLPQPDSPVGRGA